MAPALVFLHEGLGSAAQWRDFPARLAERTGFSTFAYDRRGYGRAAAPPEPFTADFMHQEAARLPSVLAAAGLHDVVLFGHSDGASIALIALAAGLRARAAVLLAPHVFVEEATTAAIAALGDPPRQAALLAGLRRHHDYPGELLAQWRAVWLSPVFARWNLEGLLPGIATPLLLVGGDADEYGTRAQLQSIAEGVRGPCELLWLPGVGHAPQRERPEVVLAGAADFLARHAGGLTGTARRVSMSRQEANMEKDPVCGMSVDPAKAAGKSEHQGRTYYFCAPVCKRKFDEAPARYLKG